jgi:succinyl-CoA synthetase alpha subunit
MALWNFVRRSFYHDSVTLMGLTRDMEAVAGVSRAAAMMGTPANRAVLHDAGLLTSDGEAAAPADLIIAVAADSPGAAETARQAAERALVPRTADGAGAARYRPRTIDTALHALPGANLALVSVPGAYAAIEARRALHAGLHVMVFSDNVPVAEEVALKRLAISRGLLLMGPDCGTAIIDGVPLGFANAVPRGRIGIAAASGTGLQEVVSVLAASGEGVSQAIGLGGRDLGDDVGGLMAMRALALLAEDPETTVICLVGKPPGARTRERLATHLTAIDKPLVVHFAGDEAPDGVPYAAATLEDTGTAAVALARGERPVARTFTDPGAAARLVTETARGLAPGQQYVRGLYSGGTLAWEARGILAARLPDVAPGLTGHGKNGHRVIDLGDDRFTIARPHPMLDATLRREWITREAANPTVAVLLLDLVLGHGAHEDPAGELAPALDEARVLAAREARTLVIVASVTGTDGDPQNRSAQVARLRAAGVLVMPSNAQAARLAALIGERVGSR